VNYFLAPLAAIDASPVDLGAFAQYGILGVLAVMLIWFAKGAHQRERDRADRLEAENRRLYQLFLDQVVPAMTSATRAAVESAELLRAVQREREQRKTKGDT
jgi:hypothetical protein